MSVLGYGTKQGQVKEGEGVTNGTGTDLEGDKGHTFPVLERCEMACLNWDVVRKCATRLATVTKEGGG